MVVAQTKYKLTNPSHYSGSEVYKHHKEELTGLTDDPELDITLLSPEHPSPGIVGLEEVVHPVQLRLVEVGVVEKPLPVSGQKAGLLH